MNAPIQPQEKLETTSKIIPMLPEHVIKPKNKVACLRCSYATWHMLEKKESEDDDAKDLLCHCSKFWSITWSKKSSDAVLCDGPFSKPEGQ